MSYITEQNQPSGWYPESTGETSGDITVRPLSIVENGTYTAPSGTAYTPVTVNVPPTTYPAAESASFGGGS